MYCGNLDYFGDSQAGTRNLDTISVGAREPYNLLVESTSLFYVQFERSRGHQPGFGHVPTY